MNIPSLLTFEAFAAVAATKIILEPLVLWVRDTFIWPRLGQIKKEMASELRILDARMASGEKVSEIIDDIISSRNHQTKLSDLLFKALGVSEDEAIASEIKKTFDPVIFQSSTSTSVKRAQNASH